MRRHIEKALKGSIKKWELILKKEGVDRRGSNCPLCQVGHCGNCPVFEKIGKGNCDRTPYEKWHRHHKRVHYPTPFNSLKIECKICERFAKQEVKFLKSLLPKRKEQRSRIKTNKVK